ncbi:AAA family ATPase [Corallococcus carmarthensis]|uniref:AAA family ATPase n=1 Tax=Corallococcus carmarthensis TaxID=2316728 RepID=UPI0020A5A2B5|nr:ATP-binding protein [Corallococcus carmarthensis]
MMLDSIHLKNFKSFADAEVKLAPLTVLVGANASGKSNLLDALRLVQRLGLGLTLTEAIQGRREAGREVFRGLRGGSAGLARTNQSSVELSFSWSFGNGLWRHHMGLQTLDMGEPEFLWEALKHEVGGMTAFDVNYVSDGAGHRWSGSLGGRPLPREDVALNKALKGANRSLLRSARNIAAHQSGFPVTPLLLCRTLESTVLLELIPERMRSYCPKQDLELAAEGENISSILWSISQDDGARQEWVDWLSELCAPEISGLDFIETELGDVMLVLVEKDGTRTPARSMSDGTLRFLGTLVALRTVPPESIVMLEEPETGLHPQRIHLLVEFLEAVTRERNIQVIMTTHSPQVLDALSSEALKNTVLCARSPEQEGTVLRRLGDLPHFEEVSKKSNIEHLFTTGWLERAL